MANTEMKLLVLCLLLCSQGKSCNEGFMDISLLTAKAEQITSMVGSMLPTLLIDSLVIAC